MSLTDSLYVNQMIDLQYQTSRDCFTEETINKIKTINNWKWAFNYIKKHPEQVSAVLSNCDPKAYNKTLLEWLATNGLISPDRYDEELDQLYCIEYNNEEYIPELGNVQEISAIKDDKELYEYIMLNPDNVHYCLVWASWEAFTYNLVKRLLDEGVFNPYEKHDAYTAHGDKHKSSFLAHCSALYNEIDIDDIKCDEKQELLDSICHYIESNYKKYQ